MTFRNKQLIMGKNCLRELLRSDPKRFVQVFVGKEEKDPLLQELREASIPVKQLPKQEMTTLVQSDSHQGFIAEVKERAHVDLKEFLSSAGESSFILLLDSIYDPQNLGAILRAAECFGVDAVLWSKNRGTDITPVVTKVSVGATELVMQIKVSNLADAVRKCKEEGYIIITAELQADAQSIQDLEFPDRTVLILGSEGEGIQPLLSKLADRRVMIPMFGKIDSLNVSQATAVFLSHWRRGK